MLLRNRYASTVAKVENVYHRVANVDNVYHRVAKVDNVYHRVAKIHNVDHKTLSKFVLLIVAVKRNFQQYFSFFY